MKYKVQVTREGNFTQTATVIVEAASRGEAELVAITEASCEGQGNVVWEDDDGSYHFGEDGVYVADPEAIEEC